MTRRIKDRTELLAFITACVLSRMAVTPFHFRTTASGAIIEPAALLTLPVAAIAALLAAGLVYLLESRHTNDPVVRRHRLRDVTGIVGSMVILESVSSFFSGSPWWMKLSVMIAGMAAISLGKSLLKPHASP